MRKLLLITTLLAILPVRFTSRGQSPVTIRFAGEAWFLDPFVKANMIPDFERKTGIQVELIRKNHEVLVSELTGDSNRAPYDLILMRHRFLGKLVESDLVQPIDAFLADPTLHNPSFDPHRQLFGNLWREISGYKSGVYGYPFTDLTMYLCYRKDLIEDQSEKAHFKARYHRDLALPKSWKEYLELAQFFTRPNDKLYGTYIQGKQHIALWFEWLNFAYSFGGDILDTRHGWEYGDIVVNSPENVEATRQYLKLIAFSPPETLNYNWDGALTALQQGHAFMGLLWNDQAPLLEDPSVSKVAGKMGYALIPSATGRPFSQLEGWTYLIPNESKHPREAYKFMEWALSPEVQVQHALKGGASCAPETYTDSRIRSIPYTPAFLAAVPIAKPKPTVPESAQITEVMKRGLYEIVTRRRSPEEGLDSVAIEIQQILGTKARLRYPVKTANKDQSLK